eukprot:comp21501_c0_seq1/m.29814 comp21501_c0_seq1/g.29814  ORF comp21501_c0_seq1/g.29814 comp21501_c0_seq1/m.29814 type:complete len:466 (-) comp21501_c0_seq1:890-2287(-)
MFNSLFFVLLGISALQCQAACNDASTEIIVAGKASCVCSPGANAKDDGSCSPLSQSDIEKCKDVTEEQKKTKPHVTSMSLEGEAAKFVVDMGSHGLGRSTTSVKVGGCESEKLSSFSSKSAGAPSCAHTLEGTADVTKLDSACGFRRRVGVKDGKALMYVEGDLTVGYTEGGEAQTATLPLSYAAPISDYTQHMLTEFSQGSATSIARVQFFVAYPLTITGADKNLEILGGDVQSGDIFVESMPAPCVATDYRIPGKWCQQTFPILVDHKKACHLDADYKITGVKFACAKDATTEECDLTSFDQSKNTPVSGDFSLTTTTSLCDAGAVTFHDSDLNITEFTRLKGGDLMLIDKLFGNNRPPAEAEYMRVTFEGKVVNDVNVVKMSSKLDGQIYRNKPVALAYNSKMQQFLFMHMGIGQPADVYNVTLDVDYVGVMGTRRRKRNIDTSLVEENDDDNVKDEQRAAF